MSKLREAPMKCTSLVYCAVAQASLLVLSAAPYFPSEVVAGPVNFHESVGGDLPQLSPLTLFALDIGVNAVSGRYSNEGNSLDFDSLAFIVPDGLFVVGGDMTVTDVSGFPTGGFWRLRSGSSAFQGGTLIKIMSLLSPGSDTIPALPSGTYNISHTGITGDGTSDF